MTTTTTAAAQFLAYMQNNHGSDNPVNRNMLTSDEIKAANELAKKGEIEKGRDENGLIIFYAPKPTWKYKN